LSRQIFPSADRAIQKEISKSIASIEESLIIELPKDHQYLQIPTKGLDENKIRDELAR